MHSCSIGVKTLQDFPHLVLFWCCWAPGPTQVSETEREDLEESEKVQHWVERLCQTRLEQITCVENESPEVQAMTGASFLAVFNHPCAVKSCQRVETLKSVKAYITCEVVFFRWIYGIYRSAFTIQFSFHMCCDFKALPTTFSNLWAHCEAFPWWSPPGHHWSGWH